MPDQRIKCHDASTDDHRAKNRQSDEQLEKYGKWFPTLTESDDSGNWTMIYTDGPVVNFPAGPEPDRRWRIKNTDHEKRAVLMLDFEDQSVYLMPGDSVVVERKNGEYSVLWINDEP